MMEYRYLGRSGIKVSELSFGSWVTFSNQVDVDAAAESMAAAYEAGVNFFDNAEVYAGGKSEQIMGAALKKLGWRRSSYLVSTKFFWGINKGPNEENTLNRKTVDRRYQRLAPALRPGLRGPHLLPPPGPDHTGRRDRLGDAQHHRAGQGALLGHIRVAGDGDHRGHRDCGQASSAQTGHGAAAVQHAGRVNASRRNMPVCSKTTATAATTFSPLASGMLTGKYNNGIPADSRGALKGYEWLHGNLDGRQFDRQSESAPACRGRIGLHPRAARDCLVSQESQRQHGHHRREPRLAGARKSEGSRGGCKITPGEYGTD